MKKTWIPDLTRRRWSKLSTNSCIGWRSKKKGLQGPGHSFVTVAQACHSCPSLSNQHTDPLAPCLWQRLWIMELYWRARPLRWMWRSSLEWQQARLTGPTLGERRPQAAGGTASLTVLTRTSTGTAAAGGTGQSSQGRRTTRQGSCWQCRASQRHCSGAARVAGLWTVAGSRTSRAHRTVG